MSIKSYHLPLYFNMNWLHELENNDEMNIYLYGYSIRESYLKRLNIISTIFLYTCLTLSFSLIITIPFFDPNANLTQYLVITSLWLLFVFFNFTFFSVREFYYYLRIFIFPSKNMKMNLKIFVVQKESREVLSELSLNGQNYNVYPSKIKSTTSNWQVFQLGHPVLIPYNENCSLFISDTKFQFNFSNKIFSDSKYFFPKQLLVIFKNK